MVVFHATAAAFGGEGGEFVVQGCAEGGAGGEDFVVVVVAGGCGGWGGGSWAGLVFRGLVREGVFWGWWGYGKMGRWERKKDEP